MQVGSLFSGIGGLDLGLEWAGMEIKWQVEIDEYCSAVLKRHWPNVPNLGDITKVPAGKIPPVDLLCGGYPCQPFSRTGKRKGKEDDRHLWPEIVRILCGFRKLGKLPSWCLFENVDGHITLGLDSVLSDLEGIGYTCWPLVIPAAAVGARHQRNRVWILAHTECNVFQGRAQESKKECVQSAKKQLGGFLFPCSWPSTAGARAYRNTDGVSRRLDRNKGLGNAVVPQEAYMIGLAIMNARYGFLAV